MGELVSYEELVQRGDLDERVTSLNQDGSPRKVYEKIEDEEALDILSLLEQSIEKGFTLEATYKYIAKVQGRSPDAIKYFCKRLQSTKKLAQMRLEAGLSRMVERVIDKAPTNELIDILSRPNIGVLEPAKRGAEAGGFILSVQAETCGAVKVGVASVSLTPGVPDGQVVSRSQPLPLSAGSGASSRQGEEEHALSENTHGGREQAPQGRDAQPAQGQPLAAHAQLPRRQDRGHRHAPQKQGLQGPHGQSAAARAKIAKRGSRKINLNYPHESLDPEA